MASLYLRGNTIWIKWYNKEIKKYEYGSIGFKNDNLGWKNAKELKKDIEASRRINRDNIVSVKSQTIGEAIQHFKTNNVKKDKSTIYGYDRFFELFTETFPDKQRCGIITKRKVETWLLSLNDLTYKRKHKNPEGNYYYTEHPYKQNSIFGFNKNLKKFLSFLFEYDYLPVPFKLNRDVTTGMEEPSIKIFEDEHISEIIQGLVKKGSNFKSIVYAMFFTGLRPSDLLTIHVEHLRLEKQVYEYYSPKTNEYKYRPFHEILVPILAERAKEVGTGPLWQYRDEMAVGLAFRRYMIELGLSNKRYNLRTFRKTVETHAYENNVTEAAAAELLGHSPVTAAKHYRKLRTGALKKEINKLQFPIKLEKSLKNSDISRDSEKHGE